ncbi:MAG TPA: oligosaccharide flippase family protein [Chloroflexota bacterium]|nr:oligosaccharide flippase family protein [Chloroflexota bacterium]
MLRRVLAATSLTFGAKMVGQGAGLLASVLVARALGPEAFGLYAFAILTAALLSEIPGAGLDLSAVRTAAGHWTTDAARARRIMLAAGGIKLSCGLALAGIGILAAGLVATYLLGRPELAHPIRVAAVGAVLLATTELVLAVYQARERYGEMLAVSSVVVAVRLAPLAVLVSLGQLDLERALLVFLAAAAAGCAVSLVAVGRLWREGRGLAPAPAGPAGGDAVGDLLRFARWFVLATLLGVVTNSLDVLAVTHFSGAAATGIYASGRTLALPLSVAGGALGIVLLPRLARLRTVEEIVGVARQIGLGLGALAASLVALVIVLAPLVLPLIFGGRYRPAVPIFQTLALAYGIQLVSWPAVSVLMTLDRPDVIAKLNLVGALWTGVLYAFVVPQYGPLGAAWVYCSGHALLLPPYAFAAVSALRAARGREQQPPVSSAPELAPPGLEVPGRV